MAVDSCHALIRTDCDAARALERRGGEAAVVLAFRAHSCFAQSCLENNACILDPVRNV